MGGYLRVPTVYKTLKYTVFVYILIFSISFNCERSELSCEVNGNSVYIY